MYENVFLMNKEQNFTIAEHLYWIFVFVNQINNETKVRLIELTKYLKKRNHFQESNELNK